MDETSEPSRKRGSYHRRDVHGIRPRKAKAVSQVGMNEINRKCNERLRESGAATNYTEEMHIKQLVKQERANRVADTIAHGEAEGVKGVWWDSKDRRFRVRIRDGESGEVTRLGTAYNIKDAIAMQGCREYGNTLKEDKGASSEGHYVDDFKGDVE